MKKIAFLIILIIDLLHSGTYYVSPSGDNSNPGTVSQPWRTPGYGSKQIRAGDTLIVLYGVYDMHLYYDDMITPPSGMPGAPTVIKGEESAKPVLRGDGSLLACIEIPGGSNIVIENFEITSIIDTPYSGGIRSGIELGGSAGEGTTVNNIVIRNIYIHHVEETGINVAGDATNLMFKRVKVERTGGPGISAPQGVAGGWRNVVVDSCYLGYAGHFYRGRDTLSPWDRPDGFGIENSEGPVEIRYTISEHNNGDGLDSKAKKTYIHHSVVANNFGDGVKLWGDSSIVENTLIYGTGDGRIEATPWCLLVIETDDSNGYFEITNVTMWDSPQRPAHYAMVSQYDYDTVPITINMRNVIVQGNHRIYISPVVHFLATYNLFYIGEEVQAYANGNEYTSSNIGSLGAGNVFGDPMFADPQWGTDGDFHLLNNSPAIDAGITLSHITDDLDLFFRPYGSTSDIGAYEWHPTEVRESKSKHEFEVEFYWGNSVKKIRNLEVYDLSGRKTFPTRAGVYFHIFREKNTEKRVKIVVLP